MKTKKSLCDHKHKHKCRHDSHYEIISINTNEENSHYVITSVKTNSENAVTT